MMRRTRHIETLMEERDRRYEAEARLRAEALRVAEDGEARALVLARDIQTYKDEKANELRSQIEREQGDRVSKDDLRAFGVAIRAEMKPALDWVATRRGRDAGGEIIFTRVVAALSVMAAIVAAVILALSA
jgi:hypothetical protein